MAAVKPEQTAGATVCGSATAGVGAAGCKQTPEAAGAAVCGSPTAAAGCKQTPEVAGAASASGMAEQSALAEESEARRAERQARDDRNKWMRFHRTLEPSNSRRKLRGGEKCPDHIKAGIAAEPAKHGYYMDLWASQKESWGAVIAYERRYSLDVTGTKFTEQWLTAGQLMGIYQDKTVVQAHG